MRKKVITISHQFGSGRHSIGKKLAEQLGKVCNHEGRGVYFGNCY